MGSNNKPNMCRGCNTAISGPYINIGGNKYHDLECRQVKNYKQVWDWDEDEQRYIPSHIPA